MRTMKNIIIDFLIVNYCKWKNKLTLLIELGD